MADAYVFGYGSLIQQASRVGTAAGADVAWPVEVAGLQRAWNYRPRHAPPLATYLGVLPRDGSTTNGVVFAVSEDDLVRLDQREANYQRVRLDPAAVSWLADPPSEWSGEKSPGAGVVWTYVCESTHRPDAEAPIVQGYVDICMAGCLEVERDHPALTTFAADFVRQTEGWSGDWVNDRLFPRSPFRQFPQALTVDRVLQEQLGELVERRRIE